MTELIQTEQGLTLTDGTLSLCADFTEQERRLRHNNLGGEMAVRACSVKGLDRPTRVLDATAGLGDDSLLLAAAGYYVDLYEYNPVIFALLEDAHRRALTVEGLKAAAERMTLHNGDSIKAMTAIAEGEDEKKPDVVFLDPMFPERRKSGLIKKKFQLLQQLELPCSDEHELICAALAAASRKVAVKRPSKGPYLDGRKPNYSLDGSSVRYDCYLIS